MKLSQFWMAGAAMPVSGFSFASKDFNLDIDETSGAVIGLSDAKANSSMNWVSTPGNAPWQPLGSRWGLGFADLGEEWLHRFYWKDPTFSHAEGGNTHKSIYDAGPLQLTVRRTLNDEDSSFTERYTFLNRGHEPLNLADRSDAALAIYTPFNDHYTNTSDSLNHRSFAHIWANGGTNSWVKLDQMGGYGRNLGLVLREGYLLGYSIESRDIISLSNTRGVFQLHPALPVLEPGKSSSVEWTLFWHDGWDDFFDQCRERSEQFIRFDISRHTPTLGENSTIRMTGGVNLDTVIDGNPVSCPHRNVCEHTYTAQEYGRKALQVSTPSEDGPRNATIYLNTVPELDDLITTRVHFIIENQQVNDWPGNPNTDGYAVFDTQAESIAFWDTNTDRTTGRERIGMGITTARYLKNHLNNTAVRSSFERYYEFVSLKLQAENGEVYDRPVGSGTSRKRLYNWPWVLQFHISAAQLPFDLAVAGKTPVERFMLTLENFYEEGGDELYAIGLPILEALRFFEETGDEARYERTRDLFIRHGDVILSRGLDYPAFEVNFEQSIVSPAAIMMLELHRATGNRTWLEAGETQLEVLLRFQGKQPDHLVHDIAIRHWDGYWFGKDRHWGDTFPHHWSTLDAVALYHYAKVTGDDSYRGHADEILRNNLALFSPDGTAGCAWIYPLTVNGRETHYRDPYANDQDWVLNHFLYIEDDNRQSS